ncbi:hypothetical protein, partial [Saccharopolyspora cebuensis]|uniref:hypothetical protein n=1 Tax=Saccharopolyspora cebuensis TaxID=418759 RepID=UPI0031F0E74C
MPTDTHTTEPAPDGATAAEDKAERLAAAAERRYRQLQHDNLRRRPEDRDSDEALWRQARREARAELRSAAIRAKATETAVNLAADLAAAERRNRRQLRPWLIAAPYAALGQAAWALAEFGSGVPVGISALCAATTAGASVLAWRRRLATACPAAFRDRLKAGLGMLCAWSAGMPLAAAAHLPGMWLALLAGIGYLALPWWRHVAHPYPLPAELDDLDTTELGEPTTAEQEVQVGRAEEIQQAWTDRVATPHGAVPGAELQILGPIARGLAFRILLDAAGRTTANTLERERDRIALA